MDLDLNELDLRRLRRLAKAMEIVGTLERWLDEKRLHDASPAVKDQSWEN
jgi:hypothetical protein